MPHATAAILSIGDELTLGQGLDTNSQWLSERLVEMGIHPVEHRTVPDEAAIICANMVDLAAAADVLICTGGLGPTPDDLTRQALAKAMGQELIEDATALETLRRWFASRTRPMPELNRVQAMRPAGAEMLNNDFGTAPGVHGAICCGWTHDPSSQPAAPGPNASPEPRVWILPTLPYSRQTEVFCLPGPPREMRPMFEAQVRARLRPALWPVRTRTLRSFGLGESEVAERLGDLMDRDNVPTVGTTVDRGVVSLRIRDEAARDDLANQRTDLLIREKLGPYVFGAEAETLPSVALDLLRSRRQTLATVESCTGGLLGALITEIPGSSAAYLGGWVTYTNELKQQQVQVPAAIFAPGGGGPGAVSRECAEAMARGGLTVSGADHCLSITGIAGPDGGSPDKPVGTVWIAMASRGAGVPSVSLDSRRFLFHGERANIRDWSARSALAMLRFALIGQPGLPLLRQVE